MRISDWSSDVCSSDLPMLTPEARALLLALALVSAGGAALFKAKAPDALPDSWLGAFATGLLALLALGIGDRTQFVPFALAARTPIPALAFVGAPLGLLAVTVPAPLKLGRASCRERGCPNVSISG